jgi:hypothetical protein
MPAVVKRELEWLWIAPGFAVVSTGQYDVSLILEATAGGLPGAYG